MSSLQPESSVNYTFSAAPVALGWQFINVSKDLTLIGISDWQYSAISSSFCRMSETHISKALFSTWENDIIYYMDRNT